MIHRVLTLALLAPIGDAFADDMPEIGPCRGLAIPVCRALDGDGDFPIENENPGKCSTVDVPLAKAVCYGLADSKSYCSTEAKKHIAGAEAICDDMVELGKSLRDGKFKPQTSCSTRDKTAEAFCVAVGTGNYSKCPKDASAKGCVEIAKLLDGLRDTLAKIATWGEKFEESTKTTSTTTTAPVATPPTVEVSVNLRSYYILKGKQDVTLLVNGAGGASKDVDVEVPEGSAENSRIVWASEVTVTDDAFGDWGFEAKQWPINFGVEFSGSKVDCGLPMPGWRDIEVQVTWQGLTAATVTGSPVLCKLRGR